MTDLAPDTFIRSYADEEADAIRERILDAGQPSSAVAKPEPVVSAFDADAQAELDESTGRYFVPEVFAERDAAVEELTRRGTLDAALETLYQAEDSDEIAAAAWWVADDPGSRQQFLEQWSMVDPDGAHAWAAGQLAEKEAELARAVEERNQDARAAGEALVEQRNREIVEAVVDFARRRPELGNPDRLQRWAAVAEAIPFSDSLTLQEKMEAAAKIAEEQQLAQETEDFQNRLLSINRLDARPAPRVPPVVPNYARLIEPQETVGDLYRNLTTPTPMRQAMAELHAAREAKQAEAADARTQQQRTFEVYEYRRALANGEVHAWRSFPPPWLKDFKG